MLGAVSVKGYKLGLLSFLFSNPDITREYQSLVANLEFLATAQALLSILPQVLISVIAICGIAIYFFALETVSQPNSQPEAET